MTNRDTATADTARASVRDHVLHRSGAAGGGPRAGKVREERVALLIDYRVTSRLPARAGHPG